MKIFLKLLLIILSISPAFADTTNSKLSDISARLITSYTATAKTPGKTVIAIFPLNADEKLTKRKTGFAVSEILSRKFIASEKFIFNTKGTCCLFAVHFTYNTKSRAFL